MTKGYILGDIDVFTAHYIRVVKTRESSKLKLLSSARKLNYMSDCLDNKKSNVKIFPIFCSHLIRRNPYITMIFVMP